MYTSMYNSGVLISHLKKITSKQNPKALTCSAVVFAFFFGGGVISLLQFQVANGLITNLQDFWIFTSWLSPADTSQLQRPNFC